MTVTAPFGAMLSCAEHAAASLTAVLVSACQRAYQLLVQLHRPGRARCKGWAARQQENQMLNTLRRCDRLELGHEVPQIAEPVAFIDRQNGRTGRRV